MKYISCIKDEEVGEVEMWKLEQESKEIWNNINDDQNLVRNILVDDFTKNKIII